MSSFIKFCFAFILFSFAIVPIYHGINTKHQEITAPTASSQLVQTDDTLSFAEIYELAAQNDFSPEYLNNIAPAAGDITAEPEAFSNGFNDFTDKTL